MGNKDKLFIYDRKEMGVLISLGLMVALFAFTLGVHLGKRVGPKSIATAPQATYPAVTVPDAVPERNEIAEQTKGISQKGDETLTQALRAEVLKTGLKLDIPRPLELPNNTINRKESKQAGYTLQIGSFAVMDEATDRMKKLVSAGLTDAFIQEVDLKEKGKRYRVYAGHFESMEEAKQVGTQYQSKNTIESFIISNKVQ